MTFGVQAEQCRFDAGDAFRGATQAEVLLLLLATREVKSPGLEEIRVRCHTSFNQWFDSVHRPWLFWGGIWRFLPKEIAALSSFGSPQFPGYGCCEAGERLIKVANFLLNNASTMFEQHCFGFPETVPGDQGRRVNQARRGSLQPKAGLPQFEGVLIGWFVFWVVRGLLRGEFR